MTQKVNLKADEAAVKVLLASMFAAERKHGKRKAEWKAALLVDVKLTVNGVEVPFLETMREMLDEEHAKVRDAAKELAIEMLSEAGLEPALAALREANVKIARIMGKVAAAVPDT